MSNYHNIFFSTACALVLGACSTHPAKVAKVAECVFPYSAQPAPLWVCDGPVEGMTVGAVGSTGKSDAGIAFMKQMAATAARVQLAQNVRVHVQNMIKQYAETTGAANKEAVDQVNTLVTKQITDETLQGTKIFRSITGPDGTMYVLVGLDDAAAEKLTQTAVTNSMNNNQAAWQQFRADKGQAELAAEIAKQENNQNK